MGFIKEPLDVDFTVESRQLSKSEEVTISEFIRSDKEKRRLKELSKSTLTRKNKHKTT